MKNYKTELLECIDAITQWEESFPYFTVDESLKVEKDKLKIFTKELINKLQDNYPFHHPLYAGQILKPPHPVAIMGYVAAMMINPNNHALDGGPATARMEKEIINLFAEKFGYTDHLGHLTSSGTIANLEALWIAREIYPDRPVFISDQAHYTHKRACELLKLDYEIIPSTSSGKMYLKALQQALSEVQAGTIVVTLGTTALGALDELDKIIVLKDKYNFRIHVDAAYGGYYKCIEKYEENFKIFGSIYSCESIAFDPHKLGMQPYGCGCIIFKDPEVGKFYKHDSPYTYFTSNDLHLGEISLECSRAGASAAALWFTLKCFEMEYDYGLGPVLKKTRESAKKFAALINDTGCYRLYIYPELDIVTYFPVDASTKAITEKTEKIFKTCMLSKDKPLYLAKLKVPSDKFLNLHPDIISDSEYVTIFRSSLLKPEHFDWVEEIITILEKHYYES
jgi:glutamate/tyrosine decarboxylase-like PLP-dependent enzyme